MDAPYHQPQDLVKDMDEMSKDMFSSKSSWFETDVPSSKADAGDDFLFERKPSASSNNPFQSFAPIDDSRGGFPLFVEAVSDGPGRMSESPTPDLVQSQESASAKHREEPLVDLVHKVPDAIVEPSDPLVNLPTSAQALRTPPSLPDILKLSPLNPDKEDSGSSEASSDSERSPARRIRNASHSALNSFSFDAKVLLLKEMAEETEARAAEKKKKQDVTSALAPSFDTFDLVKEAKTTTKGKGLQSMAEMVEKESEKLADKPVSPIQPSSVNLPPSPPFKNVVPVESDLESSITDSLSPVLDVMAKNPQNSQVEIESRCMKDSKATVEREVWGLFEEEPDAVEEASEPDAYSEEFEFVERPPKGVIDEFLETLDCSKLAKATERGTEYDLPTFGQSWMSVAEAEPEVQDVSSSQTAHHFLSQPTSGPSPQMFKAELEQSNLPSKSFAHDVQKLSPVSHDPHTHWTPEEAPRPTPRRDADEDKAPMPAWLPNLSTEPGNFTGNFHASRAVALVSPDHSRNIAVSFICFSIFSAITIHSSDNLFFPYIDLSVFLSACLLNSCCFALCVRLRACTCVTCFLTFAFVFISHFFWSTFFHPSYPFLGFCVDRHWVLKGLACLILAAYVTFHIFNTICLG